MKRLKRVGNKIISIVLILITLISILIVSQTTVYADSNDRITTFLKLAAENKLTDEDVANITEDELRFLGVYLSNFYIPFGTELGATSDETTKTTKGDMVSSLKQKLAFSDELATALVETILGYARSSMTELKIYASEKEVVIGDDLTDGKVLHELTYTAPNYYNFLRLMMGRADDVFRDYFNTVDYLAACSAEQGKEVINWNDDWITKGLNFDDFCTFIAAKNIGILSDDSDPDSYKNLNSSEKDICKTYYKVGSGKYPYIYFCYKNGNKLVPVANCKTNISSITSSGDISVDTDYTAFQIAFLKCLENVDISKGYGFSLTDFSSDDMKDADDFKSKLDTLVNSLSDKQITDMTILGEDICVDCFGDIISMGVNHQVVVVPGCMNPFTWVSVDKNGDDNKSVPYGNTYILANAMSMTQVEMTDDTKASSKGVNLFIKNYNSKDKTCRFNFNAFNDIIQKIKDNVPSNASIDNKYIVLPMSVYRGTNDYWLVDNSNVFSNLINTVDKRKNSFLAKGFTNFIEGNPYDKSAHYSKSGENTGDIKNEYINSTLTFDCAVPFTIDKDTKEMSYGVTQTNDISINTNVVLVDNLGVYKNNDGTQKEYNAFNVASFIDDSGRTGGNSSKIVFTKKSFESLYSNIQTGKMQIPTEASESALSTLYITYCWAGLYNGDNKVNTIGKLGFRLNIENLPTMENKPIDLSDVLSSALEDEQLTSIKDWLYYLLHPTEGFNYVRILITNTVNHILLGWHNDIVGTNGVGVNLGTTRYKSTMGYVTMPDLSEIQWTNSLINFYNECIPFLIVIILVLMVIAFITGVLSLQRAIAGVLLFSVFTLIPVNLINAVVGESNRISQNIYGDKFTYWALVQQESYSQSIDEAANSKGSKGTSTYENYLRTLYSENQLVYSNQGNDSILLKWQAPKKMASLVLSDKDAKSISGLSSAGKRMLNGVLNNAYSGESFTDDENAVYMYRSYIDIANFSRYIYNGIKEGIAPNVSELTGVNRDGWVEFKDGGSDKGMSALSKEYTDYIKNDYTNGYYDNGMYKGTSYNSEIYLRVPLSSNIINDALSKNYGKVSEFKDSSDMISINSDVFNFGIPMFTNKSVFFDNKKSVESKSKVFAATGGFSDDNNRVTALSNYMKGYKGYDYSGLAAYALYSENPYYYFSWKLYDDGLDSSSSLSSKTGYKDLLLGKENGGYFYNKNNGGIKDFMNLKGMFTYIIPYMKQCNEIVKEWDNIYGISIYEGVPTEEGHWDDADIKNNAELKAKYWHNLNVTRLYCLYCPWVDIMYDCSYAKAETIQVMGKSYVVKDPINPNSYPEERPMIFSEAEMSDYGLTVADLTSVEKLILKCNEQFLDKMYQLLNYYNFSDVTLNSAASINCAFAFNSIFSESGMFTENHNIYPQSFDLSNFSYDAFLRFMLSNATGESMLDDSVITGTSSGTSTGDFYERVVNNSSIITVIVMLINDFISVYLIPAFRIFFLIAMFLVAILIILISAFNIEDNMKFVRKVFVQFVIPMLLFFLTTVAFSWIISLFMGVGNNSVTQTNGISISMGDPVITLLIMIVLNVLLIIIYWKIVKNSLKDIKHQSKLVFGFLKSVMGATLGFAAGVVTGVAGGVHNTGKSIQRGIRRIKSNNRSKKQTEYLKNISDNSSKPAQVGTGVENTRANERGSSGSSSTSEDIRDTKVDDINSNKTYNANSNDDSKANEEKKKNLDSKAKNGNDVKNSDTKSEKEKDKKGDDFNK